jgi:cysteinyl-tRNA synthetase
LDLIRGALGDVLGVDVAASATAAASTDADIAALVQQRTAARAAKNWAEADRLRQALTGRGIVLEDTPQGPRWWKKS